jgi:hypothetical protein
MFTLREHYYTVNKSVNRVVLYFQAFTLSEQLKIMNTEKITTAFMKKTCSSHQISMHLLALQRHDNATTASLIPVFTQFDILPASHPWRSIGNRDIEAAAKQT